MFIFSLLAYLPFLVIAFIAQWSDHNPPARWLAYVLLLALDGFAALGGLAAILIGQGQAAQAFASQYPGLAGANWTTVGLIILVTVLLAPVCLLPAVRRALARLLPISPASSIDSIALALAVLAVGLNLAQLPLLGGLETLATRSAPVGFADLVLSNLPIALFALVGVGFLVRRAPSVAGRRLGLERLTLRQLGLVVALALTLFALDIAVTSVWQRVDPHGYQMMDALTSALYGGITGVARALAVSLSAGVGEELFFRGALQPRFGLPLTALIFTAVHVQYGFTPATLIVLVAAFVLGWLRRRVNTSACIVLHVLNDLASLVLSPLLP